MKTPYKFTRYKITDIYLKSIYVKKIWRVTQVVIEIVFDGIFPRHEMILNVVRSASAKLSLSFRRNILTAMVGYMSKPVNLIDI